MNSPLTRAGMQAPTEREAIDAQCRAHIQAMRDRIAAFAGAKIVETDDGPVIFLQEHRRCAP